MISLRSSCGISSRSPAGQSQIHRVTPSLRRAQASSAFDSSKAQHNSKLASGRATRTPAEAFGPLTAKQKQRARPAAMAPAPMRAALLVATSVAFAPKTARLPATTRARPTTALQMNFFDRFKRVAEANINNVLGKLEDPEKVLNQAVEDLQKDLVTIRQSYAEVMATQKRCARGVPSRRDAFDATRVHQTRSWVVSFSSSSDPDAPRRQGRALCHNLFG